MRFLSAHSFSAILAVLMWFVFPFAVCAETLPDSGVAEAIAVPVESSESSEITAKFEHAILPRLSENEGRGANVLVLKISGTIDLGLAPFVERALREAGSIEAIVLDVDTFGGRIDAAVQIRDAILAANVPTIAYINRRAISAGALISLAADTIVFAPGGSMGAATPVQIKDGQAEAVGEKTVSYMRAEMRATAEAKGRSGAVCEAMVDADVEIDGVTPKGKLLTVSAKEAEEFGLSAAQASTLNELLENVGLTHALIQTPEVTWSEKLARFLTDPTVSGILMSIGMLGIVVELWSPGFGLPGIVGILCLGGFFGGHYVANLAGSVELILLLVGLMLLALEVFVIPGFGVCGISGIFCVILGLTLSTTGLPLITAWEIGEFSSALGKVLISLCVTILLLVFVIRFLPKSAVGRHLVLNSSLAKNGVHPGDAGQAAPEQWAEYVGLTGVAQTDLHMAGKARIGGDLVDVVSQGDYINAGEAIRVIQVEGVRIVVVRDAQNSEKEA